MSNEKTVQSLNLVLADSYALYLKTQNYHWNVTGQNFFGLHAMFEQQYKDLAAAIDEIAERIRALGPRVGATFSLFDQQTTIPDGDENNNAEHMVKELIEDNLNIVDVLYKASEHAAQNDDKATEDLCIERITVHQKAVWMLRASHEHETIKPNL